MNVRLYWQIKRTRARWREEAVKVLSDGGSLVSSPIATRFHNCNDWIAMGKRNHHR